MDGDGLSSEDVPLHEVDSRKKQVVGNKIVPSTKVKKLLWRIVGLLILFAVFCAYVTHGFLWSTYTPIYNRLLNSIPSPPGLLSETDETNLNPELPWGYRTYWVDEDHLELVNSLVTELAHAGWESIERGARSIEREPGVILEIDDVLLVYRQQYLFNRYWLIVAVYTDVDAEGVRIGNSLVTLEIHRNAEIARSRYKP